jgi:hypothetical protein
MSEHGGGMSRQAFQVAYDGRVLDQHSMDVQELAPALLAFGRLIRETNVQLNGNKAKVRVLVTSDFEHKCFNINFEVVQNILQQISALLETEGLKDAKDILAALGIGGGGGFGLFQYLKWKAGRETEIKETTGSGDIIIETKGDGNTITVTRNVLMLSENPKIRSAVEGTLAPLGTDNVEKISFREGDKEIASYTEAEAREIVASFPINDITAPPMEDEAPDVITAWLRVYSPVFDEKAENWRFIYGDHPIYADITETTIAHDAIARGGAFINDLYKVRMEVKQHITKGGNLRPEYKIIEVIDFRPAPQQSALPFDRR